MDEKTGEHHPYLELDHFEPKDKPAEGQANAATRRGEPLEAGTKPASRDAMEAALRAIYDPEIPVNIYDLGLIYELEIDAKGDVQVIMSLTAPGCPVAGEMPGQVADALASVPGVGRVEVRLTWEPAWTPARMTEDARLALGMP